VSFSCRRLPVMILLFDCAAIRRKPYAKRISSQCRKLAAPVLVGGGGRVVGIGDGFKAGGCGTGGGMEGGVEQDGV